jgi:hypothetical protein
MPLMRGYLLGRLLALLALQGALEQPAEQLYRLAATSPPQVIPQALATLIGDGKERVLLPLMQHLPLDAFQMALFVFQYVKCRPGDPFDMLRVVYICINRKGENML